MMTSFPRIWSVVLLSVSVTGCVLASDIEGKSKAELRATSDDDLCEYRTLSDARFPSKVKKEIERRKLGDCSESHLRCRPFLDDKKLYAECKMRMEVIAAQAEAQKKAAQQAQWAEAARKSNEIILQQQMRQTYHTDCTTGPFGNVSCTTR